MKKLKLIWQIIKNNQVVVISVDNKDRLSYGRTTNCIDALTITKEAVQHFSIFTHSVEK